MLVCTVYAMLALYSYCGQKLLYADFANKIYHIISLHDLSFDSCTVLCFINVTLLKLLKDSQYFESEERLKENKYLHFQNFKYIISYIKLYNRDVSDLKSFNKCQVI